MCSVALSHTDFDWIPPWFLAHHSAHISGEDLCFHTHLGSALRTLSTTRVGINSKFC